MAGARGDKFSSERDKPATKAQMIGENSDEKSTKSSSVPGQKRKSSSAVSDQKGKSSSAVSDQKGKSSSAMSDKKGKSSSAVSDKKGKSSFPEIKSSTRIISGRRITVVGDDLDAAWEKMTKILENRNKPVDWEKILEYDEKEPWCVGAVKRKDCPRWEDYKKEIHDSRGYGVTFYPGRCVGATMEPWDFKANNEITTLEDFLSLCREAISAFNRNNMHLGEPRYRFDDKDNQDDCAIVRVVRGFWNNFNKFYVTFKACQVDDPSKVNLFRARFLFKDDMDGNGKVVQVCELENDPIWEEEKKHCRGLPCCP